MADNEEESLRPKQAPEGMKPCWSIITGYQPRDQSVEAGWQARHSQSFLRASTRSFHLSQELGRTQDHLAARPCHTVRCRRCAMRLREAHTGALWTTRAFAEGISDAYGMASDLCHQRAAIKSAVGGALITWRI